jgi:DNA-binding SARP family transcriptional activator
VQARHDSVRLGETVQVDLRESLDQANRLLSNDPELLPADTRVTALVGDLLPGWDEDWLLLERERVRQLHVHAIEALAHRLRKRGLYAQAVNAALAAIAAEPLRESAHAALISVHVEEGNLAEAHWQFDRYATMLWNELKLSPSPAFAARLGAPAAQRRTLSPRSAHQRRAMGARPT